MPLSAPNLWTPEGFKMFVDSQEGNSQITINFVGGNYMGETHHNNFNGNNNAANIGGHGNSFTQNVINNNDIDKLKDELLRILKAEHPQEGETVIELVESSSELAKSEIPNKKSILQNTLKVAGQAYDVIVNKSPQLMTAFSKWSTFLSSIQ